MSMLSLYDTVPECNLGISECSNGTPERNATMLCAMADFTMLNGFMPYPYELFAHLRHCHNAAVIRK